MYRAIMALPIIYAIILIGKPLAINQQSGGSAQAGPPDFSIGI
jgi:hypothetical protein